MAELYNNKGQPIHFREEKRIRMSKKARLRKRWEGRDRFGNAPEKVAKDGKNGR